MPASRRSWLAGFAGTLGVLVLGSFAHAQRSVTPQPLPSPNAPDPHVPSGLDRPPMAGRGTDPVDPQRERDLRSDVQKLYLLALDLKQQMDATDVKSVLSLGIVKKAQEIEKLAKRVKEHAKG